MKSLSMQFIPLEIRERTLSFLADHEHDMSDVLEISRLWELLHDQVDNNLTVVSATSTLLTHSSSLYTAMGELIFSLDRVGALG